MSTFIKINKLSIYAFHGVLELEHSVGNSYLVDCELEVDFTQAMQSDDVHDTINYAEVVEVIQAQMKQPSHLLEHVAGRIIHAIQTRWPNVLHIDLTIAKQRPPIPNADIESCAVMVKV